MHLWYKLHSPSRVVAADPKKLHVQRVFHTYSKPIQARELRHRFDERQVEELIDEAEGHS